MTGRAGGGFTLIETLIALAVAAAVAGVVLTMVNGLYRRALQSGAQTERVVGLINDSVMIRADNWRDGGLAYETDTWRLFPNTGKAPALEVNNIELGGAQPPPLALAHTPYQRFGLRREDRSLWFIARALPPPAGISTTVAPAGAASRPPAAAVPAAPKPSSAPSTP